MKIWRNIRKLLYKIDASDLTIEGVREEIDAKYDVIEQRIKEFHDIDSTATRFRYPEDKNGNPSSGVLLDKSELLQVKGVIEALEYYLSGISCGIAETTSAILEELVIRGELEAKYQ